MIVATVGHVDHGKTLLVKSLTGVDADRLPEEKKRGMTIDLGFAYLPVDSGESIGFIDVPGHEHFVHNMVCGLTSADFALLVVAADDGPMPQTREHLSMLDLLDVSHGCVALTKVDTVSPVRVEQARREIANLLAGTILAGCPIFAVSAATGEGFPPLRQHLLDATSHLPHRPRSGNFRLAIDRCFSLPGTGLVVTGTALSGSVSVDDQVRVLGSGLSLRVRTIHAQNRPAELGEAGQRCALNLVGSGLKNDHNAIRRGDWIVTGEIPGPVHKIDARMRVLKSELRPLEHWTPVHVHLGTADVTARVAILEGSAISPGSSALVQLVLSHPIGALWRDGFIFRDQSARRTIGGGRAIDVYPPARGRAKPQRVAYLAAMENVSHETALQSLLKNFPNGLNLSRFASNRNLTPAEMGEVTRDASMKAVATPAGALGFSPAIWTQMRSKALEVLAVFHRQKPNAFGPAEDRIFEEADMHLPPEVALAITVELANDGAIVKGPYGVRLPGHSPKLKPADALLWKKISPLLDETPLRPPTTHEIAVAVGEDPQRTESLLVRASRLALVVRVSENRYYRPQALRRLAKIAEELAAESGDHMVTAAAFRDRAGIGRNVTIDCLEYFDRIKFTRRVGASHQIVRPASEALGG